MTVAHHKVFVRVIGRGSALAQTSVCVFSCEERVRVRKWCTELAEIGLIALLPLSLSLSHSLLNAKKELSRLHRSTIPTCHWSCCQTGLDVALARYEWVYFLLHMLYSLPLRPATSADRILLLLRSGVLHGTVGLPVQRWQGEKGADHFHWIGGSRTVRGTRWRTVPDIAVSWCVRAPRLKSVHILHDNI